MSRFVDFQNMENTNNNNKDTTNNDCDCEDDKINTKKNGLTIQQQQRLQQRQLFQQLQQKQEAEAIANLANNGQITKSIIETLREPQFWTTTITTLPSNTCFMYSLAVGGGIGLAILGTRFHHTKSMWKSIDFGFFGLMAGSGITYYQCRTSEMNRIHDIVSNNRKTTTLKSSTTDTRE
jgi:hypothetical protein